MSLTSAEQPASSSSLRRENMSLLWWSILLSWLWFILKFKKSFAMTTSSRSHKSSFGKQSHLIGKLHLFGFTTFHNWCKIYLFISSSRSHWIGGQTVNVWWSNILPHLISVWMNRISSLLRVREWKLSMKNRNLIFHKLKNRSINVFLLVEFQFLM